MFLIRRVAASGLAALCGGELPVTGSIQEEPRRPSVMMLQVEPPEGPFPQNIFDSLKDTVGWLLCCRYQATAGLNPQWGTK